MVPARWDCVQCISSSNGIFFFLVLFFSNHIIFVKLMDVMGRSQWPRGLTLRSAAARLLRLRVRFPPRGHGCFSVGSIVCCQVEVSAKG
jgi:hypothetical protein